MFRKKILYVTDDLPSASGLRASITGDNLPVDLVHATNLAQARERLRRSEYDMILLDYCFDDGTGVELCKEIRIKDAFTPVIFHSALSREIDVANARASGCTDYLVKPDDSDRLLTILSRRLAVSPIVLTRGPRRVASSVL